MDGKDGRQMIVSYISILWILAVWDLIVCMTVPKNIAEYYVQLEKAIQDTLLFVADDAVMCDQDG